MSDLGKTIRIENEDKVVITKHRNDLIKVVKQAFSTLDPEHFLGDFATKLLSRKNKYRNVYVIGFGKASLKMYEGIRSATSGIAKYSAIIVPTGQEVSNNYPELDVLRGNHPIPASETLFSSKKIMSRLENLQEDDLVLVLISGGGSALFEIPEEEFSIEVIGQIAKCLMNSGADIHELNSVRQAMSTVKGGKLAKRLYPAEVHGFTISDVPGDDMAVIASGPLTRSSYGPNFLKNVVRKYSGSCEQVPLDELSTDKIIVEDEYFQKVSTKLILKNRDFINQISALLSDLGENVFTIPDPLTGNVVETAEWFGNKMREEYKKSGKPVWIVAGGETTAKVVGKGIGGRNCELALRVGLNMEKKEDFLFASLGTDGIDGVSPAMGGISDTLLIGKATREEILASLNLSDSYTLLNKYNSAIVTGYTGTNVSDIFVAYYGGSNEE